MKGSKLFTLINALDESEIQDLENYIEQNTGNRNKSLVQMQQICLHLKDLLGEKIDQEGLFFILFPEDKKYVDKKLRDCLYLHHQLLKDFIIQLQLKSKPERGNPILNSFLEERGLFQSLKTSIKEQEKKLLNKELIHADERKILFDIAKKRYLLNDKDYLKNRKDIIEKALFQLDSYYFSEKLKWSLELLGGEMILAHKYEVSLINEVLAKVKEEQFKTNPYLTIYYLITLFYKKNYSIENYTLLKKAILEVIELVSPQEKRSWIIDLFNYANTLYSVTGDTDLMQEIHDINELGITHDTYIKNGKFNNHNALNICNVALRLDKVDWVKQFTEDVKDKIEDQDALVLIKAMTAFQIEEYDTVRDLLQQVVYKDIFFAINAKSLLAMTYFKQKEYALLTTHLNALEHFYRRNKTLSDDLIKANLNFVLTLRRITKHVITPSKLTNISTDIEGVNNMAYKAWVHSVLKELLA